MLREDTRRGLARGLSSRLVLVRRATVESLVSVRGNIDREVKRAIRDKHFLVRLAALEVIDARRLGRNRTEVVRCLLHDPAELVRGYAANALVDLRGTTRVLRIACDAEASSTARLRIVSALVSRGDAWRARELLTYLRDPDHAVRCAAIGECLDLLTGRLASEAVAEIKRMMKKDPARSVRVEAKARLDDCSSCHSRQRRRQRDDRAVHEEALNGEHRDSAFATPRR